MVKAGVLMPYFITDKAQGCSGWATIKEDGEVIGCHTTKQDAIDQMVAVSIAEDMEPGGERALNDELEVGDYVFWDNAGHTMFGEIMSVSTFGAVKNPLGGDIVATQGRPLATIQVYTLDNGILIETSEFVVKGFAPLTKMDYQGQDEMQDEEDLVEDEIQLEEDLERAINQEAPAYMRAAARRGLEYYSDGKGGDGLVERTIREARLMADGQVSDDKWIRTAAWIARHLDDLDSPDADPNSDNYPSAGVVAHLLWGSGPSKGRARAAMEYAQRVAERIRNEERHLSGKHDQKSHGSGGKSTNPSAMSEAKKLQAKAIAAEPAITEKMQSLSQNAGGELIGLEYKIKGTDSMARKIDDKAKEEFGGDTKAAAADIGDSVRYTMALSEANYATGTKETIEGLTAEGYTLKVKNYWQEGNIYKGVNVSAVSPDGQKFELQFHTKSSFDLKETKNHKLYEEHRLPNTSKQRKSALEREMASNWDSVQNPTDLTTLSLIGSPVLQPAS